MALSSGTRLGPYEILSPVGAGGMGEVYRARDTKLNRDVALKVLPEVFAANAERMARFQREAQVLASLNHPNIAAIYGLEESGSTRALVMELVEGETLAERIGRAFVGADPRVRPPEGARTGAPLQVDEALPIARQIADALEYAHERGIIHRDLKPANIKITPEGTVKVLDFGLAKALDVGAGLEPAQSGRPQGSPLQDSPTLTAAATQAGVILGTAAYMSPEQARGRTVDRRADIWAFGCVMYEMLAGKRPFEGETVTDVLASVVKTEPDWDVLPADTPPRIRELIRRCLAKDPKQRLQAIGDARIAIEETISGVGAGFKPAPTVQDGDHRSPLQLALPWAVGFIVGALIAGVAVWKLAAPSAPRAAMHFSAVTNFAGVQAQPALSPDGRSVAFVSNRDGHYNIYVSLISGGNLLQITNSLNVKGSPHWSPDGTKLAYSQLNDSGIVDIWEVPALGGTPRRMILNAIHPDWSPDGRSFAYQNMADGAIWISDSSGQNPRVAVPALGHGLTNTEPRFSPDGREVAFVGRHNGPYGELSIAEVATGKVRRLTHDDALALSPVWSPDGASIYFASSRGGTMNIWKIAATGGEAEQVTAGQGDDAQLDVSADGKRIVFSTFRENMPIVELDLEAGPHQPSQKPLTTDPARNQTAPVYSPDGKRLAYFSNRKGAEKESIWVSNADGSSPVQVVQDNRVNVFPHWTPDGGQLVYNSKPSGMEISISDFRLVSISGGAPRVIWKDAEDNSFDVGTQGRLLFRSSDGKVQLYDPSSNKAQTLNAHPPDKNWWLLRWSPDGRSVAYVVMAGDENDPKAGLWVDNLESPPRQIFRGWVLWYARGPGDQIYLLEGKADLMGFLWKVGWNGQRLERLPLTVPLAYSYMWQIPRSAQAYFDVSPDGRHLAIDVQGVLQANIGMIENVR
jgi:eukaryotic-like serine/threonine-protein kinase